MSLSVPSSAMPVHPVVSASSDAGLETLLDSLGITPAIIARKGLPRYEVATELVLAEADAQGRHFLLTPPAAAAWRAMKAAAADDGVVIEIVSSFRDLERQAQIIRNKLARGMDIEQILRLSAPPGYSEHHTGRALDINTPGCEPTEEPFEKTAAFAWLLDHAACYGFTLSYPRNNTLGFIYEPWHWCFQPELAAKAQS